MESFSQSICAITRRANCLPIASPWALPEWAYRYHSTAANLSICGTPLCTSSLAARPPCEWSVKSLMVEAWANAKRLNGDGLAGVRIKIALDESRRAARRARGLAVGIDPVDARKRTVFVVERAVLVEDHEYIFYFLSQGFDLLFRPIDAAPLRIRVRDKIGRDIRAEVGCVVTCTRRSAAKTGCSNRETATKVAAPIATAILMRLPTMPTS